MFNFRRYLVAPLALTLALPTATPVMPRAVMSRAELHDAMRHLWVQHVEWTRMYIISAAAASPDKDATTQRLLQNQTDIGNAVAMYYGKAAGDKTTGLLKDHILIAAALVDAAKAGDKAKTDSINKKWRSNAEEIAAFLHGANPKHWPEETLKSLLFKHLDQTLDEATHRLQGNYAAAVKDYDAIEQHAIVMADALSGGIIAQFPEKFRGAKSKMASR